MAKLIYVTNVSLDGFIEDENGRFDWLPVDDEVFACHTELLRSVGVHLYGRRLYEAMSVWETNPDLAAISPAFAEFAAVWQSATKIVYSRTLGDAWTEDTAVERVFDPSFVQDLKDSADDDMYIGGADIAEQAFADGLIDECHLFVLPVIVGGGKPGLPRNMRINLDLVEERRFGNGVVLLRYAVRR